MATREELLSDPRSGAHPLGGSDPGPGYSRPPRGSTMSDEAVRERRRASSSSGTERPAAATRQAAGTSRRPAASPGRSGRRSSPARQVRRQYREHVTTNYERVIVAEFIIAVVIVAAAPFTRKDNTGLSPYYGQDVLQLVAIMAAYFILGLVAQAGQGTARVAAWFGGLLVIGIGLGKGAYVAKTFSLFGAQAQEKQAAGSEQVQGPQDAGASPAQGGA